MVEAARPSFKDIGRKESNPRPQTPEQGRQPTRVDQVRAAARQRLLGVMQRTRGMFADKRAEALAKANIGEAPTPKSETTPPGSTPAIIENQTSGAAGEKGAKVLQQGEEEAITAESAQELVALSRWSEYLRRYGPTVAPAVVVGMLGLLPSKLGVSVDDARMIAQASYAMGGALAGAALRPASRAASFISSQAQEGQSKTRRTAMRGLDVVTGAVAGSAFANGAGELSPVLEKVSPYGDDLGMGLAGTVKGVSKILGAKETIAVEVKRNMSWEQVRRFFTSPDSDTTEGLDSVSN